MRANAAVLGTIVFALAAPAVIASAQGTPQEANFAASNYVSHADFNDASGLAWAPDGTNRLFVTLKGGVAGSMGTGYVRIVKNGSLLATPFASESVWRNSECGVIGICFHPNFPTTPYVYVFLTSSSSEQKIVRYNASGDTATGRTELIVGLPTVGNNHDGGGIGFGPDGRLYWAIGDLGNGTGVDLNTGSLAAKVGRANDDGSAPSDNPLYNAGNGIGPTDYIWAAGFRNPFTLTFHPVTGHLWVNVVGTGHEQVFLVQKNDHAGYNDYEGGNQPAGGSAAPYGVYIDPKISYVTNGGGSFGGCITGGTFYRGTVFPSATHRYNYFFGDYNSGQIMRSTLDTGHTSVTNTTVFVTGVGSIVDIDEGPDGALYYVGRSGGAVRRLAYTGATPQNIIVSTGTLNVNEGSTNTFTVRLAAAPASNVTVTVARTSGDSDATVSSGGSLTFTPANWNTPQTVTIGAAQDADSTNDGATITASSSGLTSQTVAVTIVDDDPVNGAPTASITQPLNGAVVSGSGAEFYGDGSDPQGAGTLDRAEFRIDGTLVYTDTTAGGHYHIGGSHNLWNTTTLSDGPHTLTLTIFDNGGLSGSHQITVTVDNGVGGASQQDSGAQGIVSIEAEAYATNTPRGGHTWAPDTTNFAGFSGSSALQAAPNDNLANINTGYAGNSPELTFPVLFAHTGVHYVWIRGWGPDGSSDSVHAGLDGVETPTATRIGSFPVGWTWRRLTLDATDATVNVPSAGVHVVNVWMREDGFAIDKIVLTRDAAYTPAGTGPAASPIITGGGGGGGGDGGGGGCGATGAELLLGLGLAAGLRRRRRAKA